jgi:hypothetical protein
MTICHVFVMDFHGFAWTILTYATKTFRKMSSVSLLVQTEKIC